MSCPYFKEGTFGICVAPDAIHIPAIKEMENFCFRKHYGTCPNLNGKTASGADGPVQHPARVRSSQELKRY